MIWIICMTAMMTAMMAMHGEATVGARIDPGGSHVPPCPMIYLAKRILQTGCPSGFLRPEGGCRPLLVAKAKAIGQGGLWDLQGCRALVQELCSLEQVVRGRLA